MHIKQEVQESLPSCSEVGNLSKFPLNDDIIKCEEVTEEFFEEYGPVLGPVNTPRKIKTNIPRRINVSQNINIFKQGCEVERFFVRLPTLISQNC